MHSPARHPPPKHDVEVKGYGHRLGPQGGGVKDGAGFNNRAVRLAYQYCNDDATTR